GAAPDDVRASHAKPSAMSTKEQFQAYLEAGQRAEAERWLERLVNEKPNDAETRELLGSLLEAKADGPGAALQYARALECQRDPPGQADPVRLASLYAKVKELAPASPLVEKLASQFGDQREEEPSSVPDAKTDRPDPVVANGLDPDVHYTL